MENFVYDIENHKGYVNGVLIPSITQLLEIEYPMSGIDEEVLKKASERGTKVHEDIELYNRGINSTCETPEGNNYIALVEALKLKPYKVEEQVLIRNEEGEIIAYGTLDIVLQAEEYICLSSKGLLEVKNELEGGETILLEKGGLMLADIKTVSQFDNIKVQKQTNMYKLGIELNLESDISTLAGIWVRGEEEKEIRLLDIEPSEITMERVKRLVEKWKERNEEDITRGN